MTIMDKLRAKAQPVAEIPQNVRILVAISALILAISVVTLAIVASNGKGK